MNSVSLAILLVLNIPSILCGCRYPKWPEEFRWSYAGPISGWTCERILETADPHTWHDNYFCHKAGPGFRGVGMRWSSAGQISNMECTHILEAADFKGTWYDNFLCVPKGSPYKFKWSMAGPKPGKKCIRWVEPADPNTWHDNFLCM